MISANTTSKRCWRSRRSASMPVAASSIWAVGSISCSRKRSSSRAGASSSTTSARSTISYLHARLVLGHAEADARALARPAGDRQAVLRPVHAAQPLVHIHQPDPERIAAARLQHPLDQLLAHAHAVVLHAEPRLVATILGDDAYAPRPHLAAGAVAHGVLHQRLEHQHRHDGGQHLGIDAVHHAQPVAEARLLEGKVLVDVLQLLRERAELALPAEGAAE